MEGNTQASAWDLGSQRGVRVCVILRLDTQPASCSQELSGNETSQEDAAYQNIIVASMSKRTVEWISKLQSKTPVEVAPNAQKLSNHARRLTSL